MHYGGNGDRCIWRCQPKATLVFYMALRVSCCLHIRKKSVPAKILSQRANLPFNFFCSCHERRSFPSVCACMRTTRSTANLIPNYGLLQNNVGTKSTPPRNSRQGATMMGCICYIGKIDFTSFSSEDPNLGSNSFDLFPSSLIG